ncbi:MULTISPECIES: M23 family metallopeptidase [unclassified Streptomyces]|uniref:M23 family metallopeptidase n=1 Tax=unclassified Streptomyces TaxID=2593676 RepID=UPI003816E439
MSQRELFRLPRPSALRTRAGVLAAGLGVSVACGAGAAFAAAGGGDTAAPRTTTVVAAAEQARTATVKKAATWTGPVKKYTLSASYGLGGTRWSSKHSGQDFAVPIGTPVRSAYNGTVVKAGPNGGGDGPAYGNAIVVKHRNGTYSQYAHLSKIKVNIGQKVRAGQQIALSGNTGNSSGPHLHFEIRTTPHYGSAINPVGFLRSVGVKV